MRVYMSKREEKEMYPIIKKFLLTRKKCERVLIGQVSFHKIKKWIIDVVGIRKSETYAVEAKSNFDFDSIAAALNQASFYKEACVYVYVCFPKVKFERGEKGERNYLLEKCKEEGIGLLLTNSSEKKVEVYPDLEAQRSKNINFDLYHQVITQITGPYDKNLRKKLCMALGLLLTKEEIRKAYERLEYYERKSPSKQVAIETLILDEFHWPVKETIFAKTKAEDVYEEIKKEAFKEGKTPIQFLANKNIVNYLEKKFQAKDMPTPPRRYIRFMNALVKKLSNFNYSLQEWRRTEGIDEICKFIKNIKEIGADTANRIAISCNRIFGWELPEEFTLPADVKSLLGKLGLDEEDFKKEWLPIIDNTAWFLRGRKLENEFEKLRNLRGN